MRIVIFTDSLGRPRPDLDRFEKTNYEDVYGYQLKKYYEGIHDVELIYIESLDTEDAKFWGERMVAFREPDLVVFQMGINDCAPRIFQKNTFLQCILNNQFFKKYTKNIIPRIASKFRLFITKNFQKVYVKPNEFELNYKHIMNTIKKYNQNCQFLCLSIFESDLLDNKSYGFNKNVIKYNYLLKKIFEDKYIDINSLLTKPCLISDGVHMAKKAHDEVFHLLKQKVEQVCAE